MFFRRPQPKPLTFQDRLDCAREAGFAVTPLDGNRVRVTRDRCAAVFEEGRLLEPAGLLTGEEIGRLVDEGFQKFFETPSGKRKPALANELRAIHAFEEDLREVLGLVSLYNESLGTVSTFYQYDRLKDRDKGVAQRPWDKCNSR